MNIKNQPNFFSSEPELNLKNYSVKIKSKRAVFTKETASSSNEKVTDAFEGIKKSADLNSTETKELSSKVSLIKKENQPSGQTKQTDIIAKQASIIAKKKLPPLPSPPQRNTPAGLQQQKALPPLPPPPSSASKRPPLPTPPQKSTLAGLQQQKALPPLPPRPSSVQRPPLPKPPQRNTTSSAQQQKAPPLPPKRSTSSSTTAQKAPPPLPQRSVSPQKIVTSEEIDKQSSHLKLKNEFGNLLYSPKFTDEDKIDKLKEIKNKLKNSDFNQAEIDKMMRKADEIIKVTQEEVLKKNRTTHHIVTEFKQTEKTFKMQTKLAGDILHAITQKEGNAHLSKMLDAFHQLSTLSNFIFEKLTQATESTTIPEEIKKIFYLDAYQSYSETIIAIKLGFTKLNEELAKLSKKVDIQEVIKTAFSDSQFKDSGLGVGDLTITPIQRIPRHELLMKDLIRNSTNAHSKHALENALKKIKEKAKNINDAQ